MSDLHILRQSLDLKTADVVFHVPVPAAGTNSAGLTWREAVVEELGGADNIESVMPGIAPLELTQMKAGALIERRESFRFSIIGLTNQQRLNEISARFTALSASVTAELQVVLAFTGFATDV